MKSFTRLLSIVFLVIVAVLLVGPFLIPVPPLKDTVPPEELADSDSRFIEINGIMVHYKIAGQGEPVYLLLHGFASSLYTWREVMPALAQNGTVIAYDRPAFGLTERPLTWTGENPYSTQAQVDLAVGLMDKLGITKAILVGNSAGGTISILTALQHPERVQALILVDPAVYTGNATPAWQRFLYKIPQVNHLGPLIVRNIQKWGLDFARSAWHDPSKITSEIWAGYTKPLQSENWDKGLWYFTTSSQPIDLASRLNELDLPVLVLTGDDDRIVPTAQSVRLSKDVPGARLVFIPNCGHIPQEEQPQAFLQAVRQFVK